MIASNFSDDVQLTVGPVLAQLGFKLDHVDSSPERGARRVIVYYRSDDCKIQIYWSEREGEVNCMIAPLDAANSFGLRTQKWQYLTRFAKRPDIPFNDLLQLVRAEYRSYDNPVAWVRDQLIRHYQVAHAKIMEMYPAAGSQEPVGE